jgi:aryl-alcohol dehydrogenase-like predicted oxidoreductase
MQDGDGVALLQAAYERGYRHFDTAEVYRQVEATLEGTCKWNEELLGLWLRTLPEGHDATVASKYFPNLHDGRCDAATVEQALDTSLERLGLRSLDVYYLHRMPATVALLETWMHALKGLVARGKVRHVGLSEAPVAWLRRAHAVHAVALLQQEWSLATRLVESEGLVDACRELGVGIVAYSPLARSVLAALAAAPSDWRASVPRLAGAHFEANAALVREVGTADASAAQLSLAWLLTKGAQLGVRVLPIPGTTSARHMEDNWRAAELSPLPPGEMERLEAIGGRVVGARGSDAYRTMTIEGVSQLPTEPPSP